MKLFGAICHVLNFHRPFWRYVAQNEIRICQHCGIEQRWGYLTREWYEAGR